MTSKVTNRWLSILAFFWERKPISIALFGSVLISSVLESLSIAMVLPIVDAALDTKAQSDLSNLFINVFQMINVDINLVTVSGIFVLVIFFKGLSIVLREGLKSYFSYSYKKEATLSINKYLYNMPYNSFIEVKQGKYISDAIKQTDLATHMLLQFIEFVIALITVIGFSIFMFLAEPYISVWLFLFGGLIFGSSKLALFSYSRSVGTEELKLNQVLTEYLSSFVLMMREFRLHLLQNYQLDRLRNNYNRLIKLLVRWDIITATISPVIELLISISLFLVIFVMLETNSEHSLISHFSTLSVILILSQKLFQRASRLSITFLAVNKHYASFEAIQSYIYALSNYELAKEERVFELSRFDSSDIIFKNVSVKNVKNQSLLLHDVSLEIETGKVTGIVGPTGSGKSTLIDLIVGLRVVDDGEITISGVDISKISITSLRKHISVVSQSTQLQNDTIMNNIALGNLNSSKQSIIDITKKIGIYEFIQALPEGFETIVGNQGNLISGGQAQRISLARALVRDSQIYIFDEATSALDSQTEENLNRYLFKSLEGKTVIVVTHRQSALKYCDAIYNVNDGKVQKIK